MFAQARLIGLCALGLFIAGLMLALHMERRHARKLSELVTELTELRKSDRASYEAAQVAAKALNDATLARVKQQQEQVNETVASDYRRDLERLRALPRANPGAPRGAGISPHGPTTVRPPQDGLPILAGDDLLAAQEIELRLMHLQRWTLEQGGVTTAPR